MEDDLDRFPKSRRRPGKRPKKKNRGRCNNISRTTFQQDRNKLFKPTFPSPTARNGCCQYHYDPNSVCNDKATHYFTLGNNIRLCKQHYNAVKEMHQNVHVYNRFGVYDTPTSVKKATEELKRRENLYSHLPGYLDKNHSNWINTLVRVVSINESHER